MILTDPLRALMLAIANVLWFLRSLWPTLNYGKIDLVDGTQRLVIWKKWLWIEYKVLVIDINAPAPK